MKHLYLSIVFLAIVQIAFSQPKMQATLKPGASPRTMDVYLKSSASFSQRDEAMTFALAIPVTVTNGPTLGSAGVTENTLGPVTGVAGLQPSFLINNLGTTQREVFVSTQEINGVPNYIYTFIFAGTATTSHNWVANEEQQIFSIQFNGCTGGCFPETEQLVNLPKGGKFEISYWYFQSNTIGDITNYVEPFYENSKTKSPENGQSTDGSALSTLRLASSVSLSSGLVLASTGSQLVTATTEEEAIRQRLAMSSAANPATTSGKADFTVYPNPAINNVTKLQLANQPKGSYTAKLLSALGQVVYTKLINHSGGTSSQSLELSGIPKGYYILQVTGDNNITKSIKLVI